MHAFVGNIKFSYLVVHERVLLQTDARDRCSSKAQQPMPPEHACTEGERVAGDDNHVNDAVSHAAREGSGVGGAGVLTVCAVHNGGDKEKSSGDKEALVASEEDLVSAQGTKVRQVGTKHGESVERGEEAENGEDERGAGVEAHEHEVGGGETGHERDQRDLRRS